MLVFYSIRIIVFIKRMKINRFFIVLLFKLQINSKIFYNISDIDECERGTPCGEVNTCTNIIGGHVCTCSTGYRASLDTKSCIDIDECTEGENICQNGNCINTLGSFLCSCQLGYKLELNAMSCIGKLFFKLSN